jgi:RNA polymerase-associated protein RTF1
VAFRRETIPPNEGAMSDADERKDEEFPEDSPLQNIDPLQFEDIRDVTIPRSRLLKWFMEPFFEDLLPGCFIRIPIYQHKDGSRKYRLYMVKSVDANDPTKTYNFENYATHKYLILVTHTRMSDDMCKMTEASDSSPLEKEFQEWLQVTAHSQCNLFNPY